MTACCPRDTLSETSTLTVMASSIYPSTKAVRVGKYTMRGLAFLNGMLDGSGNGLLRS